MRAPLRKIGNSHGFLVPRSLLEQIGLTPGPGVEAEMILQDGALVLRKPDQPVRVGWGKASAKIAESGDDTLVMGEFGNLDDRDLAW